MQPTGINPSLIRILPSTGPDLLSELFAPGKVLDADVVSVFQDRAILSFGRGVRLEVALQAPLQEGQRVRVQVQAQPGTGAPPAAAQQAPAQAGAEQPAPVPQAPVFMPRPNPAVPPQSQPAVTAGAPAVAGEPAQALAVPVEAAPAPQAAPVPATEPANEPAAQQQPAAPQTQEAAPQPAPTTVSAFIARQAASLGTGPQQLLRPIALPQAGAPEAQPQAQAQTATRQPTPAPAQQPAGGNPPPVVLKVIATLPPRDPARPAGPAPTAAPLPDQPAAAAAKATGAAAVREALTTPGQPAPVSNQQPAQQANTPQVFWLPVPLPDGKQGWAQLYIQEDDSPKARSSKGGPTHEVRIWWETPSLGPVQVTLDAAADKLAALFTAAAPESKGALETLLPELQRRLSQVGFPEARVGCRTAAPGEAVEPARAQGASRLDKRL